MNYDYSLIEDAAYGELPTIIELLDAYIMEMPAMLHTLRKAIENKDAAAIYTVSHSLKSITQVAGMWSIVNEVIELHSLSYDLKHLDRIQLLFLQIEKVCLDVVKEMNIKLTKLK